VSSDYLPVAVVATFLTVRIPKIDDMSPRHTAVPDSASEAPNGQMKNNRPTPKRRSTTSDAIETAEAIKKESRELCDELDVNLKKLRTVIERSRGNGSRTNVIELWMK